jgi:hypothetical protein
MFGWLLRVFSYLFHTILCLYLLGVWLVAHGIHSVPKLGFVPFSDEQMLTGILALSLAGLISTALAVTGIFRFLFPIWTIVLLWLMVRGYFFSGYTFAGADAFRSAVLLAIGALVAFLGGLSVLMKAKRR